MVALITIATFLACAFSVLSIHFYAEGKIEQAKRRELFNKRLAEI